MKQKTQQICGQMDEVHVYQMAMHHVLNFNLHFSVLIALNLDNYLKMWSNWHKVNTDESTLKDSVSSIEQVFIEMCKTSYAPLSE